MESSKMNKKIWYAINSRQYKRFTNKMKEYFNSTVLVTTTIIARRQ